MNEEFIFTLSVSYPRCGFSAVYNNLLKYFLESDINNFKVCFRHQNKNDKNSVFSKEVPCKIPGVILQKTHDFLLNVQKDPSIQYLFLYRNPMSSLVSNFKLYKRNGGQLSWKQHVIGAIDHWNAFMGKWHFNNESIKVHKIFYDDLVQEPLTEFTKLINYIAPKHMINQEKLTKVTKNIRFINKIEDFEFYDVDDFKRYEDLTIWSKIKSL